MTVVDVHTHMLSEEWLAMVRAQGAPDIELRPTPSGAEALFEDGVQSFTPCPEMFDYALRIRDMDAAGIDVAIVSLTGPSVYWGGAEASARAARAINRSMRDAEAAYPGRIRHLATLPWQYPDLALAELEHAGAVGVMVLANIRGMTLTDPALAPVWEDIDRRRLPVLVHPTTPPGVKDMDLGRLLPAVGFPFDTSLAVGRMILDGFIDHYPDLSLIAAHGGGTLPYLAGRMDLFFDQRVAPEERRTAEPPSSYLRRVYYDSIVFQPKCLELCIEVGGADRVLFGTDYPHPTDIPMLLSDVDALPAREAAAVRGANAERLFGL